MPLSTDEVGYIAELARLDLSPAEKESFRQQLSVILDYFARLQRVDTQEISPTSVILLNFSRLREDFTQFGLSLEELLANATETENDQFRIPPVIGHR